jgi:hypothetical protein
VTFVNSPRRVPLPPARMTPRVVADMKQTLDGISCQ